MAIIVAKYNSRCGACGQFIDAGERINFERGKKATHVDCASGAAASKRRDAERVERHTPRPAAAPSVEDAPFVAYEKWEPCKRAFLRSAVGEVRRDAKARGESLKRLSGVFVVVSQDAHYQNAEDNEDMGDCSGAGWLVTLYLRRATPEEEQKDVESRLGPALVKWAEAMIVSRKVSAKREADAAFEALASRPGCTQVNLWRIHAWMGEGEGEDLWKDERGSWRRRVDLPDGGEVIISHDYIYDWDQPFQVAGPTDLLERAAVAEAIPGIFYALERFARSSGALVEGKVA